MTERSIILSNPKNFQYQTVKNQTTGFSRFMNVLMEKFDSIAASFYKFTNS
jgi:hypothetical protein